MFPNLKGTKRYDKVEVIIPDNFTKNFIPFDDQPQLRSDQDYDIVIQAIEMFTIFDQALSQSGNTMPDVSQMISTAMVLYIDGEESVFNVPLTQLHRCVAVDGSGNIVPHVRDLQVFDNVQVSWEKCQLFNPASAGWNTGASGSFSFEFGVHYLRLPPGTMKKLAAIRDANYCQLANAQQQQQMGRITY